MYADTHDRPNLDEQYIMATNASNITVDADRTTAADHLIAAGLAGSSLSTDLANMQTQWAAAKPAHWTEEAVVFRAQLLFDVLGKGKGKPDVKRVRAETIAAYTRAQREASLRLPARARVAAAATDWAVRRGIDLDFVPLAIYRYLQPACPVCEGRASPLMPEAPVLAREQCRACNGTGENPVPGDADRILKWLKGCASKAGGDRQALMRGKADVTPMAERLRGPIEADDTPEEQARVAEHFRRSLGLGRIKG